MSRLTERDGASYTYNEYATTKSGSCCFGVARLRNQAIDKLGKLEDIEEEHGIEITTLSKLLKQGFVYIRTNGGIEKNQGFIIDNTGLWSQVRLDPKKYGKKESGGWALTKEASNYAHSTIRLSTSRGPDARDVPTASICKTNYPQ